jgi:ribonucleotide monophosphatase NagD (HAD superfamily)
VISAKVLLVDWDGCVMQDECFIPGADVFLRRFQKNTTILSNNSPAMPQTFAAILEEAASRSDRTVFFLLVIKRLSMRKTP